ncbi:MAG: choice-of-anchor X domain-containing protein [Pseudomonadota bacterium]
MSLQFSDGCDYESPVYELVLIRDETAPAIEYVRLAGGQAYTKDATVALAVAASDELTTAMEMRVAACNVAENGTFACDPTLDASSWVPYREVQSVTFSGGQGRKGAQVQVRDRAHNETAVAEASIILDSEAPEVTSLTIGNGSGTITSAEAEIQAKVTGAQWMQVGEESGLGGVAWQPFAQSFSYHFGSEEGTKNLFARFKDEAGNVGGEVTATAALVLRGTVTGRVELELGGDPSQVEVVLMGTEHRTSPTTEGIYSIGGVPAGSYLAEYRGTGEVAGRYEIVQALASVSAGSTSVIPTVMLLMAHGDLAGSVTLEGASDNAGILVEIVGTALFTTTLASGSCAIARVPVGTYGVRFSRAGFVGKTVSGIAVVDGVTTVVPAEQLLLHRGSVEGQVLLEGGGDPSVVEVVLLGTSYQASAGTDGGFSISGVPAGGYLLEYRPTGTAAGELHSVQATATVAAGAATVLPTATLPMARGVVAGSVTLEGASEHGGVLVEVVGTVLFTTTLPGGAYEIAGIPVGTYGARFSKAGFAGKTVSGIAVVDGVTTAVPAEQLLLHRGSVEGQVLLEDNGDPSVVEVVLLGTSYRASVAVGGTFSIGAVPAGGYLAEYRPTGAATTRYRRAQVAVTVTAGAAATLPAAALPLTRGDIAGSVTLEDASEHGGVFVEVVGTALFTTTLPSGSYAIANVPVGTYTVRFSRASFVGVTASGVVVADGVATAVPAQQILVSRGSLSGVVRFDDAADHSGIAVALVGTPYQATTASDGSWSIPALAPTFYNLEASKEGYIPVRENGLYVASAVDTAAGTLLLTRRRGLVAGTVELEGMANHAGALVTLLGSSYSTTSAADGSYQLSVPLGNYGGVRATMDGYAPAEATATITVTDVGTANIGPLLLRAVSNDISGKVTLFNQPSALGILVEVFGVVGQPTEDYSLSHLIDDPSGSFALTGVPIGPYYIKYSYGSGWETITRSIQVAAGPASTLSTEVLRQQYVVIDAGAAYATQLAVTLSLGSSDCALTMISNLADFAGATWDACAASKAWVLAGPDGTNTVYAKFLDSQSNESAVVLDSIWLDRSATIASVTEDTTGAPVHRNDTIHFVLAASGEAGGTATVDVVGYANGIALYDDGTHGDVVASDGTYELDYKVALSKDVNGATVTGHFTDRYGNVAAPANAAGTVTIAIPPLIRNVRVVPDSETGVATVSWETDEQAQGVLQWGLDDFYGNSEADVTYAYGHSFEIGGGALAPSTAYHYRIAATDLAGNQAMTVDAVFYMRPNQPEMVVAMPGDDRFDVRWEAPPQENVVGYNVYRATASGGPYSKLNGGVLYTSEALAYFDVDVENDTQYFYYVTAVDEFGNESEGSAAVSGTPQANAGPTYVSGVLAPNQVWTTKGSPYIVQGNALVEAANSLVIGPGTQVLFDGSYMIRINGRIAVIGAEGAEVLITSNMPVPARGDWRTLRIRSTSPAGRLALAAGTYAAGNLFYRARVEYAGEGAIGCESATLAIIRSTIATSSDGAGIDCSGGTGTARCYGAVAAYQSNVLVASSVITDNRHTLFSTNDDTLGGGLALRGGSAAIHASTVSNNYVDWWNYGYSGGGIAAIEAVLQVNGSTITNNQCAASTSRNGGGMILAGTTATVVGSTISSNRSGSDISAGGIAVVSGGSTVVADSDIVDNTCAGDRSSAGGILAAGHTLVVGARILGNALTGSPRGPAAQAVAAGDIDVVACTIGDSSPAGGVPLVIFGEGYGLYARPVGVTADLLWNHFVGDSGGGTLVTMGLAGDVIGGSSFLDDSASVLVESTLVGGTLDCGASYWGAVTTAEMDSEGVYSNIVRIYDYQDDFDLARVLYDNWVSSAFPLAHIDTPYWGQRVSQSETLALSGYADDPEDGAISSASLVWRDDDAGVLGTGDTLEVSGLALGHHKVWLTATDSQGQEGKVWVELDVVN